MLERLEFETSDRDEAIAAISAMTGAAFSVPGTDPIRLRQTALLSDHVLDGRVDLGAGFTAVNDPDDLLHVVVSEGAYAVETAGTRHTVPGGRAIRPPTHVPSTFLVPAGAAEVTSLRGPVVREVAREVFLEEPADLDLTNALLPVSAAMELLWKSTAGLYRDEVLRDEIYANDLIRENATRALIVTTITAFGLHRPGETRAAPTPALRRARAYIEEHLEDAITVHDIAKAARIGVRSLQSAFQDAYGTTPLGYLRAARLEAARRDLVAADPTRGDSVAAVARRWGFAHLGRFSVTYRQMFDEPPSQTLRR